MGTGSHPGHQDQRLGTLSFSPPASCAQVIQLICNEVLRREATPGKNEAEGDMREAVATCDSETLCTLGSTCRHPSFRLLCSIQWTLRAAPLCSSTVLSLLSVPAASGFAGVDYASVPGVSY